MKVAYDLDGVIIPLLKRSKPFYKYSGIERRRYEKVRLWQYINDKVYYRPTETVFYIISARQEKYRVQTEEWLDKNNIKAKEVLLMDNSLTFENIMAHKLKYLKEKKIDKYYEDDPKIIKALKKELPNLNIVEIPRTPQSVKTEEDITKNNPKILE